MFLKSIFTTLLAGHQALATTSSSTSSLRSSAVASNSSPSSTPGHDGPGSYIRPTVTANNLTFGRHYAVLNLDLVNGIVNNLATSAPGQAFINNTAAWINLVHAQNPPPLSIFTRIYFANERKPELKPNGPFFQTSRTFTTANQTLTQIYPAFNVNASAGDLVLQKTGYYAGTGNALETILAAQGIDTVILSGVRTSGVILSTVYNLFDLGYNVYVPRSGLAASFTYTLDRYVIANNTIESAPNTPGINSAILEGIIPKLAANVITIEQATAALARSGPAIY